MKRSIILFFSSLILFTCSSNEVKEVNKYTIEQFYQNTNIWGGSFAPDESKFLVTSNKTGIYNVFALPLDGSKLQQLTNSVKESFFATSYVPNGNGFLYYADKGGDENDHIFWVDSKSNTLDLTAFDGAKSNFYGWSMALNQISTDGVEMRKVFSLFLIDVIPNSSIYTKKKSINSRTRKRIN